MAESHLVLSLARLATALLASLIAVAALRAYLGTRRGVLLALFAGAGLLAAGYLVAGVLVELAGWSIAAASALESVFTLTGVACLVLSLYVREGPRARRRTPGDEPPSRDAS